MGDLRSQSRDHRLITCAAPAEQFFAHREEISAAIVRVLEAGNYVLGAEVRAFETAFANFCGARYGVGVNSGTDALILALKALDIGPGDEVITVSHTALATVAAIVAAGALPVLVDIDPIHYTIDPCCFEAALTPRTKAIIVVHLYGQPAEMDSVLAIARKHRVAVIEDCAQAAGSEFHGRRVGGIGDLGCFSFYPTKNLGAIGDGGMVVANEADVAERLRCLRQYGWNGRRTTAEVGINSRLDELQAAVLAVKLRTLDADNARRIRIAESYRQGLSDLPLVLPAVQRACKHVYHLFVIACEKREALKEHLASNGISAGIHYPVPAHRHGGYDVRVRISAAGLGTTEALVDKILTLPLYPELTDAQVDQVISAVRSYHV